MPQCVFKNCKNNQRNKSLSDGISYFRFPGDPFYSAKWVSIVIKERKEVFFRPVKSAVVCSNHFDELDIVGNPQRRRLKKTALPKLPIETECQDEIKGEPTDKSPLRIVKIERSTSESDEQNPDIVETVESRDMEAILRSSPTVSMSDLLPVYETRGERFLRNKLNHSRQVIKTQSNKVNLLQKRNKRLIKKNTSLKNLVQLLVQKLGQVGRTLRKNELGR